MQKAMSALPPKADMCSALAYVRFVPIADMNRYRRKSSVKKIVKTFDELATVGNNWSCGGEEDDDDQYTRGVPKAPSPRHSNLAVNRHVFDTILPIVVWSAAASPATAREL